MSGKIIGGRYQILSPLGGGGFGTTFIAEDRHLPGNPQCVVKQLKPKTSDTSSALQAARRLFEREAEVLYQLGNHPQIPQLFAHFEEDQEFYLVQEFIRGHELRQELLVGQPLSEAQVVALLQEILEILTFVHQQDVIHRDIKPSNLIRSQQDGKLVLIDFGAVKQIGTQVINSQGQTSITIAVGSPGYMPNEQMAGKPRFCSDIYAVGMLGIQALTGLHPKKLPEDLHTSEIIWRDQVTVNSELADVLDRMVRYDFRQRYRTATEALEALKSVVQTSSLVGIVLPRSPLEPEAIAQTTLPMIPEVLAAELRVDYTPLQDLLKAGQWQEADRETQALMLKVAAREQEGWIRATDMKNFPCQCLRTIDQLWVNYSNGRFGFSVQQRIWLSVGGSQHEDYEVSCRFAERVGWRVDGNWVLWQELNFSSSAVVGHLPSLAVDGGEGFGGEPGEESLFARVEACGLPESTLVLSKVNPNTISPSSSEQKTNSRQRRLISVESRLAVVEGDLTQQQVEAIVNPTDLSCSGRGGVDRAIHQAAGSELREACRHFKNQPTWATGEAEITRGFNLPALWVIHTVSPIWRGGNYQEEQQLAQCYRNCLALAEQHAIHTIAFPAISAGTNGFPMERATRIAIAEVRFFLERFTSIEKVIFVCFNQQAYRCYSTVIQEMFE